MDNIKDIVKSVIANMAGCKNEAEGILEDSWKKILKKEEQNHVKFEGQKNGTLSILVDSPARLYEFQIKKSKLLKQLQQGSPEITEIHFKIGNV